jgi:hypothetical protein
MALDKELLLEVSELNAFVVADKVEPVVALLNCNDESLDEFDALIVELDKLKLLTNARLLELKDVDTLLLGMLLLVTGTEEEEADEFAS